MDQTMMEFLSGPEFRALAPAKQRILREMLQMLEGRSLNEKVQVMLSYGFRMQNQGLALTGEESKMLMKVLQEGLTPEEIRELIHIAHEEGFSVMAHANGARTVEAAAMAGLDSVEHGAYLDLDAIQAMADMGTVWVPTLSTIGNLRGKGRFSEDDVVRIFESAMNNCATFASLGGLLAPGTDAGAWSVPHGSNTEEIYLKEILGQHTVAILTQGAKAIQDRFVRK